MYVILLHIKSTSITHCGKGQCVKRQEWDGYYGIMYLSRLHSISKYSLSIEPCKEDDFQCKNGECVPLVNLCDGLPHCKDGSDEAHCGMFHFRKTL